MSNYNGHIEPPDYCPAARRDANGCYVMESRPAPPAATPECSAPPAAPTPAPAPKRKRKQKETEAAPPPPSAAPTPRPVQTTFVCPLCHRTFTKTFAKRPTLDQLHFERRLQLTHHVCSSREAAQ